MMQDYTALAQFRLNMDLNRATDPDLLEYALMAWQDAGEGEGRALRAAAILRDACNINGILAFAYVRKAVGP